jgi:hypothetical protein
MTRRCLTLITVLALVLTGCGTDASPGHSQSQPGPGPVTSPAPPPAASEAKVYDCVLLLTDSEAQAATGVDLSLYDPGSGADDPFEGYTDCGYFASDGTYLQVTVWTGPAYEQGFLPQAQAARAGAAEPVSGVGDEAGWSAELATLGVRVGGTGVTIAFAFVDDREPDQLRAWALSLATVVIARV